MCVYTKMYTWMFIGALFEITTGNNPSDHQWLMDKQM